MALHCALTGPVCPVSWAWSLSPQPWLPAFLPLSCSLPPGLMVGDSAGSFPAHSCSAPVLPALAFIPPFSTPFLAWAPSSILPCGGVPHVLVSSPDFGSPPRQGFGSCNLLPCGDAPLPWAVPGVYSFVSVLMSWPHRCPPQAWAIRLSVALSWDVALAGRVFMFEATLGSGCGTQEGQTGLSLSCLSLVGGGRAQGLCQGVCLW